MGGEADHLAEYEYRRLLGYRRAESEPTQLASLHDSARCLIDACAARRGVHIGHWKRVRRKLFLHPGILKPYTREVLEAFGEIQGKFLSPYVDEEDVVRARTLFESIEKRCQEVLARPVTKVRPVRRAWGERVWRPGTPRFPPKEWFTSFVAFYRPLGFFREGRFRRMADAAVAQDLFVEDVRRLEGTMPPPPLEDLQTRELSALAEDSHRVWWQDTEADVGPANEVYVDTFKGWARISRGAFSPVDIVERWEGQEGPVVVEFTLAGARHRVSPEYLDDYIDTNVLAQVNRIIAPGGLRFEGIWPIDQSMFIVVLNSEEKEKMERDRGLRFVLFEQEEPGPSASGSPGPPGRSAGSKRSPPPR